MSAATTAQQTTAACSTFSASACPTDRCKPIGSGCVAKTAVAVQQECSSFTEFSTCNSDPDRCVWYSNNRCVEKSALASTIIPPTNLIATLTGTNVVLTWDLGSVRTSFEPAAALVAELNQITGNAGFFDSIANFFKNLFGIGTRGTLTQQNLVYDVLRDGSAIQTGIKCTSSCSYTDTTTQQGKTYTYKIGVRASTEVFSSTSVKFSNEASINIPAAGQPTYGVLDFNKDGRVDITVSGSDLLGSDGTLFTQHFGTITSSSNWDARYDLYADGKVDSDDFLVLADLLASACSTINVDLCPTGRCEVVQGPSSARICGDKTAGQPTYGVLDFNKDGRVDITVSGSDVSGTDGVLFTQHFETTTSSSNWDVAYDLNADGKVDFDDFLVLADLLPSEGQAALTDITVNVASTLNVGGRATATISGGTPTYRVAPLPGSSTICKIVVPIPNADGTAFVGGSTFTVEGIAAGTCMIRVTDSQAKFKDVSITIGSTASVDQKPCGELTANECAQQSSRCQLIEDNCVDKTTTTVTCIAAGGEGCSSIVSNGESEIANGNSFCDTAESGSVCVKCNEGFSWDIASENCLSDNPKANGESCTHSNECLSRICSSENVCSENLDLYDFNDDRCVDILDVDILGAKFGGSDLTYDLNNDGKIDFDDALFLADSHGLGDACPIVKGDFNNNRCIENNDKTILEEELAKPESNRGAVFDANADGRVNTDDLLYLRTHYREGGKCALLDPLPGDITKDRCVDGRDIIAFTDAMRSTATGAVYLNDQNRDGLLDGRDIQVIRSSFGGENCPDTVFTYGDFNGNGQVEITVGETTGELTGADGLLFKNHMGTTEAGGGNWDATYDLNADGKVDFDDFLVLADLFGVTEERTSFNSQAGSTVSLLSSKIRLSFSATETVNTDIRGRYLSFNPKSSNVGGKVGLNFVDLTSTQSLTGKVSQLVIKVGYDDQDVQDLGLVENSLRMYYFNDGTNDWELLTGSVDTVNNLVTGITTHLSVYGLFGDNVVTTSPDTDTDAGTGDGTAAGTGTASGGRRGSSTSAPGCNTLLVQNSQDGDCKRICEYTIEFWQSKGYNTVSECADAVPTPPVGGDIPTVDDYYSTGVDQSNVDRDQDGMIDDLEIQYFGTLGQGFDDDFDGDGVSDGRELADGTDPTNPDEFKEGGGIGTVLLIIIILVLIGAAGSILWLKKQGKIGSISSFNKVSSNVSLTSQEKKIVRYIEEARLAGMSTSVIRANLIKAGWTREQINNAFSSLK